MAKCSSKGCKKGATLRVEVGDKNSKKSRPVCVDCSKNVDGTIVANNATVKPDEMDNHDPAEYNMTT